MRIAVVAAATVLSIVRLAVASDADAAKRTIHIPPQELGSALQELARAEKMHLILASDDVTRIHTQGLSGDFTVDEALKLLLTGTGLMYQRLDATTITILPIPSEPQSDASRGRAAEESLIPSQTADGHLSVVEEVVVTASKRAERLKDVPAAVTALSSDGLRRVHAQKLEDYATSVPGLSVDSTVAGGVGNQVTLRGITTGLGGNPTVGFYIDDAPYGSSTLLGSGALTAPDLDPTDLAQIEVLRGPQGTLYGAGAMGGLIKFVTRDPDLVRFDGHFQLDGATVDRGGNGWGVRGGVNVPLVDDELGVRINGFSREDPGYIDNVTNGANDINASQYDGGRISALWKPAEGTSVRLSALAQRVRNSGEPSIDVDPFTSRPVFGELESQRAPNASSTNATLSLYDLHLAHDFGFAEIVSDTSYGELRATGRSDFSHFLGRVVDAIFGTVGAGALIDSATRNSKLAQELRLTSQGDSRLAWQVGVFYTYERAKYFESDLAMDPTSGDLLALPGLFSVFSDATFEESAAFGNVTHAFTDRFDVMVGLRYSRNRQDNTQALGGVFADGTTRVDSSDSAITYLVNPRFRVNENLMVYGRIASGYRPGGPNIAAGSTASYGPDYVVTYEVGLKGELLDRKLSYDLAVFDIDWTKIQLRMLTPLGAQFFDNGARASSRGVELSSLYSPSERLQIATNVAYLDATLDSASATIAIAAMPGDRLPVSAKWSGSFNVDYDFPLGSADLDAFVGSSWRFVGDRLGDFPTLGSANPRAQLPSYSALDLRAGLKRGDWSVTLYAKNVNDARGRISAFEQGAFHHVGIIPPRTVGVTLSASF